MRSIFFAVSLLLAGCAPIETRPVDCLGAISYHRQTNFHVFKVVQVRTLAQGEQCKVEGYHLGNSPWVMCSSFDDSQCRSDE